jgi:acyl-CoA reductase-like NAD-dependent aldehyde dehydrogenase
MATREAPGRTGTALEVENPATGEVIATVPKLGAEEASALVDRARAAQPAWETLGMDGRGEVLLRARRWLGENSERVIETIVSETGKSWDDAEFSEVVYGVQALGFWPRVAPEYLGDSACRPPVSHAPPTTPPAPSTRPTFIREASLRLAPL